LGSILKKGDLVIYESTVYPGATEEQCVPVLSSASGLLFNEDFYVGYSPERINPGDKVHRLADIVKVTSGSTTEIADAVTKLYGTIITAGIHKASSIKVAEAAKVIENTQRDLNIALINELAIIFNRLNIDTESVLLAAGTKWNFLPFRPGLVGGHCIGVDPYYLTHKAQEVGYHPEVILSGRRINDSMGDYIAGIFIKSLLKANISPLNSKVLVLGFTFKENCPDIRNTKVIDIIDGLNNFNVSIDVFDPLVSDGDKRTVDGINWIDQIENNSYAGVIVAVAHDAFKLMGIKKIRSFCKSGGLVMDIKYIFSESEVDIRI
jgi:UDP-N-acetyl-D-galactosamine dehydrogenase